jgi:hypothetical protein
VSDRTLARIAALLRKAETTDNEHEADAFLQAAQRLATLASVDLAVARAHTESRERRAVPVQRTVEIGQAGKRGLRTYVQLYLAIAGSNSVTCDVARNSTRVFAYGFDSDLDTVQLLYSSLVVQMVRACDEYLRSPARADDVAVTREVVTTPGRRRTRWVSKPVHASTARINFQEAFAGRIKQRLDSARRAAQEEIVEERGEAGVALVLRAKELELTEHYRTHSTARGTWGGYRSTATWSESSRQAGDQAGRRARLGEQSAIGGRRVAIEQ